MYFTFERFQAEHPVYHPAAGALGVTKAKASRCMLAAEIHPLHVPVSYSQLPKSRVRPVSTRVLMLLRIRHQALSLAA